MKTLLYAVSVQWGNGWHYFVRTDIKDRPSAHMHALAALQRARLTSSKYGAKPVVRVWKRLEEHHD